MQMVQDCSRRMGNKRVSVVPPHSCGAAQQGAAAMMALIDVHGDMTAAPKKQCVKTASDLRVAEAY